MDPRPAAVLEVDPETWPEAYSRALDPPRRRRALSPRIALPALFLLAATAHALASLAHVTPAIFTDELLHSKLAQSFAAGDPFSIRGERFLFPAPLPALLQAPAWLFGSVPFGYEVAKVLNALVMSSAVFPAYWLARRFTRPSWALVAAALAVAAPAMLYHAYLLSEALAYPVFLTAAAVMVRALDTPSRRWALAVIGVSLVAVATRTQFAVLPAAFALGGAGRRPARAALPCAAARRLRRPRRDRARDARRRRSARTRARRSSSTGSARCCSGHARPACCSRSRPGSWSCPARCSGSCCWCGAGRIAPSESS